MNMCHIDSLACHDESSSNPQANKEAARLAAEPLGLASDGSLHPGMTLAITEDWK
jgi:hypothetical protein